MSVEMKNNELKIADVIIIEDYKYIVYNFKKNKIELIPINLILENNDYNPFLIPKVEIEDIHLNKYIRTNNDDLYYLFNQKNCLIKQVLGKYFE